MNTRWGKSILAQFLQLGTLPNCAICQRPAHHVFCSSCYQQVEECRFVPSHFSTHNGLSVLAWGQYTGKLRTALAQLKYNHQPGVAQFLGQQLGIIWLQSHRYDLRPIVIPIPLHRERELHRGYNQSALIAKSFCHVTGLELAADGLIRIRATEAQFGLSAIERFKNVAQAFRLSNDFLKRYSQRSVLLLDDIYTSGATAQSACKALSEQGLKMFGVAVVARA